jgi:hypothetical protein
MNDPDDEVWFEALAGRATADSTATDEARALRDALLAQLERDATDAPADADRASRLLERARRAGVLLPPRAWSLRLGLAAATLLGLGTAFWLLAPSQSPSFVVRSAPDGAIRIEAADPRALKRQLLRDLRDAGIDASGYEFLGREGIEAELPEQPTPAMTALLQHYGIIATRGSMRIEISAAQ